MTQAVHELDIPLDRDLFLRVLVRELSGALEDIVGLRETTGFISLVGKAVGDGLNREYKNALSALQLDRDQVREVLLDLKRRIQGDFYIVEEDEDKIVFGNRRCPFGDQVIGRTSMCMITSNVFGAIASQNLGYAKVELKETIAAGNPGCRVVLYLNPTPEARACEGREYVKS